MSPVQNRSLRGNESLKYEEKQEAIELELNDEEES